MKLVMRVDDIYPVSNNDMYIPTRGKGRYGAFLRRSGALNEFQNKLWSKITEKYNQDILKFLDMSKSLYSHLGFKVNLWIGMNDMFYKRNPEDLRPYDASNYIKAIEDTFAKIFEHDDKYNMEFSVIKYDVESEAWIIIIEYIPIDYMNYVYPGAIDIPIIDGIKFESGDILCKYCVHYLKECKKCIQPYEYWIKGVSIENGKTNNK